MKSIAVIGQGFVGGSLTTVFSEKGARVLVYDKADKISPGGVDPRSQLACREYIRSQPQYSTKEFAKSCELNPSFSGIFFLCLPTPMKPDGFADLTILDSVLNELATEETERIGQI